MAQIFTGGRSDFFWAENFLHANSICQPLLYKERGTLVPVASLPEERRCQSWVGRLATFVRVTSSSPLSQASCSSVGAPLDRFRRWCEKKTWRAGAGLLLLRQVSGVLKCEKTRYLLAWPATPRANGASSSTCRRRPRSAKGFLSAGKLTNTATGIAVDEKQLISWARTNRPKKKRKHRHVSFEVEAASRKKRKWCAISICCSRQKSRCVDLVALHISECVWMAAQKPGSTVKISFPLFVFTRRLLSRDRDRQRNWPRTERRPKVSDAKSILANFWKVEVGTLAWDVMRFRRIAKRSLRGAKPLLSWGVWGHAPPEILKSRLSNKHF